MKQTICFLVLASCFAACSSSNAKGQKFSGAAGNPKSMKYYFYDNDVEEQRYGSAYYQFNELGLIEKEVVYDSEENEFYSQIYTYKDGKCIEIKLFYRHYDETVTTLKNRTSKSEVWESKKTDGQTETTYKEVKKRKTTKVIKDFDGIIKSETEETSDKNGNITEYKISHNGEIFLWYKSTFDDKSQIIEKEVISGSGEGIYTYKYDSFDEKGNWTKKIEYNKNGEIQSLTIREIKY